MSAEITAWLDDAQAKLDAATEGPWVIYPSITSISYIEQSQRDGSVIGGRHVADAGPGDVAFIADARTRLPQAIAALRAVLELVADCEADPRRHALADDLTATIAAALGVQP